MASDSKRSLTIIRPTVIFGEQNRGNVYNLLNQIASGRFLMIGNGRNIKSMAYVENVAAFIEYNLSNTEGEHLFNYIDKPDFDMNTLVGEVYKTLGKSPRIMHWPYGLGYFAGKCFDFLGLIMHKKFAISSIRVKKFCSDTMFCSQNIPKTDFIPPYNLKDGLHKTILYEFVDKIQDNLFYSE